MTFSRLWTFMAVALPVLAGLLATISTVDVAYQVRAGQLMLDQGAVLRTDPFTFTAGGQPWLDQQWGAQVLFAIVYRMAGWAGLAVFRAVFVALITGLVYLACRREGADRRIASWLTLAGFGIAAIALGMRPQLIGMALFAATLAILAGRRRWPAGIWLVPVLTLLWANVHGSFFLGPLAVGAAWLEDVVTPAPGTRRLALAGAVSLAATVFSPFGPAVWTYALGIAGDPIIRRIVTEWQPTSPFTVPGALFYASAIAVVVLWIAARRSATERTTAEREHQPISPEPVERLPVMWPRLLWLGGLFLVAVMTQRGLAWWAIAAPVAIAPLVAGLVADRRARGVSPPGPEPASRANVVVLAVLVLAGVVLLPMWRAMDPVAGPAGLLTDAPPGIATHLVAVATPVDRVWNAQGWGSWLELTAPGIRLAVDSRIEVIPAAAWTDALALDGGSADWSAILDRWGVTIVVASRDEQAALIPLLKASPAWHLDYEDDDGAIFVRVRPTI